MADFFVYKDGTTSAEVTDPASSEDLMTEKAIMDFQSASNDITRKLAETSAELVHRRDVYYNTRNAVILAYAAAQRGDLHTVQDNLKELLKYYE